MDMKKKALPVILVALFAALFSGCGDNVVWKPLFETPIPGRTSSIVIPEVTPAGPDETGPSADELFQNEAGSMENPKIVVTKSTHTLELWDGDTLMARIKVAYGRGEAGPKQKKGDNRTPEGDYFVCKTDENEKYYKSLFISYPNTDDASAGLADDIITQEKYDEISADILNRKQPDWTTGLGGEIAICGTGSVGKNKTGDWTAGNIVLDDKDMDYLWEYVKVGTDVEIIP